MAFPKKILRHKVWALWTNIVINANVYREGGFHKTFVKMSQEEINLKLVFDNFFHIMEEENPQIAFIIDDKSVLS